MCPGEEQDLKCHVHICGNGLCGKRIADALDPIFIPINHQIRRSVTYVGVSLINQDAPNMSDQSGYTKPSSLTHLTVSDGQAVA